MTKFYVYDRTRDNWSCGYNTRWEAENDLFYDISYAWGLEAEVIEVNER